MSKKSILVVEQDAGLRTILTLALELKGHLVLTSRTLEEALDKVTLSSNPIEFVLYHMPQEEELSLRKLKNACLRKFNKIPAILSPIMSEESSGLINLHDLEIFLERSAS